jgi:hypothetical protein
VAVRAPDPRPRHRKSLGESAGLSRPAAAERLGVSAEALRTWEEGLREPQGTNRDVYLQMLTQWGGGTQEPAQEPTEPEPEPEAGLPPWSDPQGYPGLQPGRGDSTAVDRQAARQVAHSGHHTKMRRIYGRG